METTSGGLALGPEDSGPHSVPKMTGQSTLGRQSVTVADSPQKGQTAPVMAASDEDVPYTTSGPERMPLEDRGQNGSGRPGDAWPR
jgi:hypothetical protein